MTVLGLYVLIVTAISTTIVGAGLLHVKVVRPLMQLPDKLERRIESMIETILLAEATEGPLRELIEEVVSAEAKVIVRQLAAIERRLGRIENRGKVRRSDD